jgi:hypothetical protein
MHYKRLWRGCDGQKVIPAVPAEALASAPEELKRNLDDLESMMVRACTQLGRIARRVAYTRMMIDMDNEGS